MIWQQGTPRIDMRSLGRVRLYREDLKEIAVTLAKFGNLTITRRDDDSGILTGNSPEVFDETRRDLPERIKKLTYIAQACDGRRIEVELSAEVARVKFPYLDYECAGIFSLIESIIKRHDKRVPAIDVLAFIFLVLVIQSAIVLAGFLVEKLAAHEEVSASQIVLLVASILFSYLILKFGRRIPKAVLINADRGPSFFKRNRDHILLHIVFLVIGFWLGKISS